MVDCSAETDVSLDVCSPAGSVSILPTVLYLLLGVLRELVHWPTHSGNAKPNILNWKAYCHYNGATPKKHYINVYTYSFTHMYHIQQIVK